MGGFLKNNRLFSRRESGFDLAFAEADDQRIAAVEGFQVDPKGGQRKLVFHDHLPIIVVLCLGTALAAGGYFGAQSYYRAQAERDFERAAGQYTAVVQRAIDGYDEVIKSIKTFFTVSNEVDRWEFLKFVEEHLQRQPGIQALGWVPRISGAERAQYERRAAEDGLFGFGVTEFDAAGHLVRAAMRDEYLPFYYVDPYEGNENALGFDLSSDPGSLASLIRGRDTGRMQAIPPLSLIRRISEQPGFSVVLPIYASGDVPPTLDARRRDLTGFAIGVFRIDQMMAAALESFKSRTALEAYLYEGSGPSDLQLLYYHPSPLRDGDPSPLPKAAVFRGDFSTTSHEAAGREWFIVVKPSPGQFASKAGYIPLQIAMTTLLLTAMLVQYMISVRHRTLVLAAANSALESEVTERKMAEEEARAAKDQAVLANRAKSEFLAMVSHELRTPLNAIIGFSEVMSKQYFGPIGQNQYLEYAEDIQFSGTHLLSLINDILDLSKVEADKFELHMQEIDLAQAVDAALRIVRSRAEDAGLRLTRDLPVSLPELHADERALKQILINLLSNAVKFTPKGGEISVSARTDGEGGIVLSVADTGIGMAPGDLEKVFQPFTQVDAALSRKYEGTGLGLTLTKSLVELHGGSLKLESALGRGTTARVNFGKGSVILTQNTVELLQWIRSSGEAGTAAAVTLIDAGPDTTRVRSTRVINLDPKRCMPSGRSSRRNRILQRLATGE